MWAFSLILDLFVLTTNQNWIQPTYLRKLKINWNRAKNVGLSCLILTLHLALNFIFFFFTICQDYSYIIHILDEFDPLRQSMLIVSGQLDGDHDNGKGKKKMKVKGRNKQRPVTHIKAKDKLCPTIFQEKECRFGEKCKFSHDIKEFMESKPKDIGSHCFMFETYGKCPFGLACRYGSKHISEDFKNIVNQELYEEKSKVSSETMLSYTPFFFREQGGSKLCLFDWNMRMIWLKELRLWTWVEGVLGSWYLFILRSICF